MTEKLFKSVVMDEGTELLSREAMNTTNRVLTKTFFVQRALGFLVIVNIPNFHLLDSTLRKHRVRTLVEVTNRAKYKCITGTGISKVAKDGMESKDVNGVRLQNGTFWQGDFRKEFPKTIDRDSYEKHKMGSIKDLIESLKDDVVHKKMIAVSKVAKEIGCKPDTLIKQVKKQEVEGKMIGSKWYMTRGAYDKLMTT